MSGVSAQLRSPRNIIKPNPACTQHFPGSPVAKICASKAGGIGLMPGQGTEILHAT